jgi:hypothetical protein
MGIKDAESFETAVLAVLPRIVALVPKEPAAKLGRWQPKGYRPQGTRVQSALEELGNLLAERLLGALELTVDKLTVDIPADLLAGLPEPRTGRFGFVTAGEASATRQAVSFVEHVHPGAADLVVELVEALQDKASVPDASGDEEGIAAQHGAAYFALAVVVSTAVLGALGTDMARATPAIVGVALGVAATVLPTVPKPGAYADAVLAKRRAEYLIPRMSSLSAAVTDNRFWIAESPDLENAGLGNAGLENSMPEDTDFAENGLVVVVPGGVVVRTGSAASHQRVTIEVLAEPPAELDLTGWDEVVDISWTAVQGGAKISGTVDRNPHMWRGHHTWESPPWPGDYRLRVKAQGRDEADDNYHLAIWQAPAEPGIVHKKTDRLGHRLRGEPEPAVLLEPHAEYKWIAKSSLSEAATITVVVGLASDEVVRTFGGDPSAPISIQAFVERLNLQRGYTYQAPLTVLAVDGAVLAVEENGFQGADDDRIKALSRKGKAASVYWNVNANFRLTFAERGKLVYSGDAAYEAAPPDTDDLDFTDFRNREALGVVAVARFTGRGITKADLAAIYAADQAYVVDA